MEDQLRGAADAERQPADGGPGSLVVSDVDSTPVQQVVIAPYPEVPPFQSTVSIPVKDTIGMYEGLEEALADPANCGIALDDLEALFSTIEADMMDYCAHHGVDRQFRHVCNSPNCPFDHMGCRIVSSADAAQPVHPLPPTLHLVVSRYVKPWTKPTGVSYAGAVIGQHLTEGLLKGGFLAQLNARKGAVNAAMFKKLPCKKKGVIADTFISHNWSEAFPDFMKTARRMANKSTAVWVCAFAINQNAEIGGELGTDLGQVPFARALLAANRVVVFMDGSALTLSRVWCVFEMHLAVKSSKERFICLPDNDVMEDWKVVQNKLSTLDIRDCQASVKSDLDLIMAHIAGQEDLINEKVRETVSRACEEAHALDAARRGDLTTLKGASNPLCCDAGRVVAMHLAATASSGAVEVMGWLLGKGVQVTVEDVDHKTPLHFAAETGNVAALRFLVGKDPSIIAVEDENGATPVGAAAAAGQVDFLRAAVELGGKLEAPRRSSTCASPMYMAAKHGQTKALRALAEMGAQVDRPCFDRTPLMAAVGSGHGEVVAVLVQELKANVQAQMSKRPWHTVLCVAAGAGHKEVVLQLVQLRADLEAFNKEGLAAIHVAAQIGSSRGVRALAGARADVNCLVKKGVATKGFTPLHFAAQIMFSDTLEALVELRGDPNARMTNFIFKRMTPLHIAGAVGSSHCAAALLRLGAEKDPLAHVATEKDASPLAFAAGMGHAPCVQVLLDAGADIASEGRVPCLRGLTPLIRATNQGHLSVVKLLIEREADPNTALGRACCTSNMSPLHLVTVLDRGDIARALIDGKAYLETRNRSCFFHGNCTPLMFAAFLGSTKVSEALLDAGADPEVTTWGCCKVRAAHIAAFAGKGRVLEVLCKYGADLEAKTFCCYTPFLVAVSFLRYPTACFISRLGAFVPCPYRLCCPRRRKDGPVERIHIKPAGAEP